MNKVGTPLRQFSLVRPDGAGRIWIKDESVWPGGTFKARLAAAVQRTAPRNAAVVAVSYGNTALAVAAMLRVHRPDLSAHFVLPKSLLRWEMHGADGTRVNGAAFVAFLEATPRVTLEFDELSDWVADDDLERRALAQHPNATTILNITEGLTTPAYEQIPLEVLESATGPLAALVVPYGAGMLANESGDVLRRLSPNTALVPISVGHRSDLARMLFGPAWVEPHQPSDVVTRSRHRSPDKLGRKRPGYPVQLASPAEVLSAVRLADELRINAEPSGAIGLSLLDPDASIAHRVWPTIPPGDVVIVATGDAAGWLCAELP